MARDVDRYNPCSCSDCGIKFDLFEHEETGELVCRDCLFENEEEGEDE